MTLRDLTKRQLYNLRRRCEKENKKYERRIQMSVGIGSRPYWQAAFNAGLKAGLEVPRP